MNKLIKGDKRTLFLRIFHQKIELFSVSANIRRFWEKRIVLLLQFVKRLHVAMANNHSKKRKPSLRNNHYLFKQWEHLGNA